LLLWTKLTRSRTDFNNPQGSLKGIIAAAYSLGAILSLPLIPMVNDRFGRRWSIFGGSCIMVVGALIQGFSVHGESICVCSALPASS
jgi:MFS family permease